LNQNPKNLFLFLSAAQNHFGPVILAAHLTFFSLRTGPSGIRPTWESSPTSVARAAFGLAGAAAPLAVIGRPPVRVRSQSDALPGRLLFPHTNSMPRRLPSPYYSSKPAELSSTEPPPSPHHLPIPRIGSLHPHPYCPPIELGSLPLLSRHRPAKPRRPAPVPTNVAVRFPSVPSVSRCFRGELPPSIAAACHMPVSAPPHPGRESTVD
jgi:hypothetical protein